MAVRAIRGATSVESNTKEAIYDAASELVTEIVKRNALSSDDIISIHFTATRDLDAAYPAVAPRAMGYTDTPLFCSQEMHVEGSLPRCIRALIHVSAEKTKQEIIHVYLHEAEKLRPDLSGK